MAQFSLSRASTREWDSEAADRPDPALRATLSRGRGKVAMNAPELA
jgi:hypothetical protein